MKSPKNLKRLLRIFSKLFGVLTLLILTLILALLVVAQWPSLLITPKTMSLVASYLEKQGFQIRWKAIKTSVQSISFYDKRIHLDFSEVCWKTTSAEYQGCLEQASINAHVNLRTMPPTITQAGPLTLLGGTLRIKPGNDKNQETPQQDGVENNGDWIPEWVQKIQFTQVQIDLKKIQLHFPEEIFMGTLSLKSEEQKQGLRWILRASERSQSQQGQTVLKIDSPRPQLKGPYSVQSSGTLNLAQGPRIRFKLAMKQIGERLSEAAFTYTASGDVVQKGLDLTVRLKGSADFGATGMFQATINSQLEEPFKNVKRLTAKNCNLNLKRINQELHSGHLFINCPLQAKIDLAQINKAQELRLPDTHTAVVRADLLTSFLPDPDSPVQGQVWLHVPRASTPYLDAQAELTSTVEGIPSNFPEKWTTQTDLKLKIDVASFEKLVQTLSLTDFAIPAPLNALQGNLSIKIAGSGNLNEGEFPLAIRTHLESATQKFDLNGNGQFDFFKQEEQWTTSLDLRLLLSDIQLQLPQLPLGLPPRLFPDSRIISDSKPLKEPNASTFLYDIQIATPNDQPIRILSNLAKRPVPISLNLHLQTDKPISGNLSVSRFPLVAFKRNATVETFNLFLDPIPRINGSMRVDYTDYTVKVNVEGPTDKPQIRLTSEPPLPEDQLISVLLFGRPPEELDPNEGESFGDARAALQARAINLASLYLLAATPVESIGYDTRTNGLSAKLRLGSGTSLNISTGLETPSFGFRKRLSRFWTLTTDVTPLSETGVVTAFLEWNHRY